MFNTEELTVKLNQLAQSQALAGVSACIMGPEGMLYDFSYGFIDSNKSIAPNHDTLFESFHEQIHHGAVHLSSGR